MGYEQILYEVKDRVATVTLNRPDKLNAWTGVMGREVRQAMEEAARDEAVRVIVLTGAGRGFCAGADMQMLSGIAGAGRQDVGEAAAERAPAAAGGDAAIRPDFRGPYAYFPMVPKPIIAALNGATAGLGLVVSLYCDLRIAADTAVFTTAFSRRGLIAEHGVSWMLPRLVGLQHALDLLLSARKITAAEALAMGLVDKVVPDAEVYQAARGLVSRYAVGPAVALRAATQAIDEGLDVDLDSGLEIERLNFAGLFATEDQRTGMRSFIENGPGKASFAGR